MVEQVHIILFIDLLIMPQCGAVVLLYFGCGTAHLMVFIGIEKGGG